MISVTYEDNFFRRELAIEGMQESSKECYIVKSNKVIFINKITVYQELRAGRLMTVQETDIGFKIDYYQTKHYNAQ